MRVSSMAIVSAALLMAPGAWSQVTPANTPLHGPEGSRLFGELPPDARPPSPDPRDLNGVYAMDRSAMPRAPSGPPASAGAPFGAASEPSEPDQCKPDIRIGSSGYSDQIIQTPGRVTFIAESNHVIRSVYLDQPFPKKIEPSYAGYSVGHWEGDTLVIETRGLKSNSVGRADGIASITRMIERVRKVDGGKRLEIKAVVEGLDAQGRAMQANVDGSVAWRSDLHLIEYICEDGSDKFFKK